MQSAKFESTAYMTLGYYASYDMPTWTTSVQANTPYQFGTCKEVLMVRAGTRYKYLYGKFATAPQGFADFVKSLNKYCKSKLSVKIYHGAAVGGRTKNERDYFLVVELDKAWTRANWQLGLLAAILDMGWSCQFSDIKQMEAIPLRTGVARYSACYSWRGLLANVWRAAGTYSSFWFVLRNMDRIKEFGQNSGKSLAGWLALSKSGRDYYRKLFRNTSTHNYKNWFGIEAEFPEVREMLTTTRLTKQLALEIMGGK